MQRVGVGKRVLIATIVFAVPYYACQRYLSQHVGLGLMLGAEYLGIVQRASPASLTAPGTGMLVFYSNTQIFLQPPSWFMYAAAPLQETLLAGPPLWLALLIYHKLTFREHLHGHVYCKRCGYDLTGNTSGVCPECGAAIWNARLKSCSCCPRQPVCCFCS